MNDPLAPDFRFVTLVRETYWLMRGVIDTRLEPLGLSQARWRPLLCLYHHDGPMTQVQLARALSLESPTLVRLLDRLSDAGWVQRKHCPQDRRAYHVVLTARARRLCLDIDRIVAEFRGQALAGVPAAELKAAIAVLERVRTQIAALAENPAAKPSPRRAVARKRRTIA